MIEAIDHVVLYSGDSERTIAFYQDVLGCVVEGVDEWRAGRMPVFRIRINETMFVNVHASGHELHPRAVTAVPGSSSAQRFVPPADWSRPRSPQPMPSATVACDLLLREGYHETRALNARIDEQTIVAC